MITAKHVEGDMQFGGLKVLYGLSKDEKPIDLWMGNRLIGNGSIFHEIDTGDEYMYDEEGKRWVKQPK